MATEVPPPPPPPGDDERAATVSNPALLGAVWRLQTTMRLLEGLLWAIVAGLPLAIGGVYSWAYVASWALGGVAGALLLLRAAQVRNLRTRLGLRRISLHPSGRWLAIDSRSPSGWSFDLSRPTLPPAPLLGPAILFLLWVLVQLVPLPPSLVEAVQTKAILPVPPSPALWRPLSVSPGDTLRGACFVAAAVMFHLLAVVVLDRPDTSRRFVRGIAFLGLVLSAIGFGQLALGVRWVYGVWIPDVGRSNIFGPFVNRDHFAGFMLLVLPLALARFARDFSRYQQRAGNSPNMRRRLVALASAEGNAMFLSLIPAVAGVGALAACASRAGATAFVGGLGVAGLLSRRKGRERAAWTVVAALVVGSLAWTGVDALRERFLLLDDNVRGRLGIWWQSYQRMDGLWITGSGFNTFPWAVSRSVPFRLPLGATPWIDATTDASLASTRVALVVPEIAATLLYFQEAHCDYLQVLVETGVPGLALALLAGGRALWRVRGDPWLVAALLSSMAHVLVDFDYQIPAVAALFVVVAALPPHPLRTERERTGRRRRREESPKGSDATVEAEAEAEAP